MGTVAFLIDFLVEHLGEFRWEMAQRLLSINDAEHVFLAWFVLVIFSVIYVLVAAIITAYIAP
jgi:H+/Cl- antiporter ClcA